MFPPGVTFEVLAIAWPVIIFPGMAIVGGLAATMMFVRHRRRRRRVAARLAEFKQEAVRLSETLDKLRERHKMLPFIDHDFTEPMVGATHQKYGEIQQKLNSFGDGWLKLMDRWDQAQQLLDAESIGRRQKFEEAATLLQDETELKILGQLEQDSNAALETLESAHEDGQKILGQVEDASESLAQNLESVEAAAFSTDAWQDELDSAAELTDLGRRMMSPDPIGALDVLNRALETIRQAIHETRTIMDYASTRAERQVDVQKLEAEIQQLRNVGYLFAEPEYSPEPPLASARRDLDVLNESLSHGDVAGSGTVLERITQQCDQVRKLMDESVANRTGLVERIRTAESRIAELNQLAEKTDVAVDRLRDEFAPDSWLRVGDNPLDSREMLTAMGRVLDEARSAASESVQHYSRARQLLLRIETRDADIVALLEAVDQRFHELVVLRNECTTIAGELQAEERRLGGLLTGSSADRSLCNHRYEQCRQQLAALQTTMRAMTVDWPAIRRQLTDIGSDLNRVDEMFQEDLRLLNEASAEIARAERETRQAKSFYRAGVAADVGPATLQLSNARQALELQDYERAGQIAQEAEQAARDALATAQSAMQLRQQEVERGRRKEQVRQMGDFLQAAGSAVFEAMLNNNKPRR